MYVQLLKFINAFTGRLLGYDAKVEKSTMSDGLPDILGERPGRHIKTMWGNVYGGSYYDKPRDIDGIKMAKEIELPSYVSVPTKDFSVPAVGDMKFGILMGILRMKEVGEIYAGCMGGIGRTGMYLSAIAKVESIINGTINDDNTSTIPDYISRVRVEYDSRAVETKEQVTFLRNLDLYDIARIVSDNDLTI